MTTSARTPQYEFAENALKKGNISLPGRCGHRPLQGAFLDLKHLDKPKFDELFCDMWAVLHSAQTESLLFV